MVLAVLQPHQLYANGKKPEFRKTRINYLGRIITVNGVAANPNKIQAMMDWSTPTNGRELWGFLGLTGYYRMFIVGYAHIASPLIPQLKKDQFGWTLEATISFQVLKQALTSAPVLAMPDFSQPFVIEQMHPEMA